MKKCPSCGKVYEDEQMRFCLEDGSVLVDSQTSGADSDATLVLPNQSIPASTMRVTQPTPPATITSAGAGLGATPTSKPNQMVPRRRGAAVPILLSAVILGIAAIVVALIVTRNRSNANPETQSVSTASPVETSQATPPNSQGNAVNSSDASRTSANAVTDQTNKSREQPTPAKLPATSQQTSGSEPPASPPVKPAPRGPISAGVLNGKAVRLVQPVYPAIARSAHVSGQVRVQVVIDENGNVVSASPVSGPPLLQGAAVAAARQSKFTPTMLSGQPVKVSGVIVYNFVEQ
jgi:TonB family protein